MRLFTCPICKKRFSRKSNLEQHRKLYHAVPSDPSLPPPPIPRKFACSECSKRFLSNADLGRHLKLHSGVKDFRCHVCGKEFTQKGHLTDHMRIHQGLKEFTCRFCERAFTLNSHLTRHVRHKHIDSIHSIKEEAVALELLPTSDSQHNLNHIMLHH
uniref:Chorion transcription factor Cf2 n=1 Tax=Cacopsylla melanoneura TaxID=428564 RepID=A0A8D8VIN5_9HEMI